MKKDKLNQAFSLIELIIVITIVGILIGIFLANYRYFSEQKKLDKDVTALVDMLEMAKNKTVAGDKAYDDACANFNGYGVIAINNSFSLNLCCNATCEGNATQKSNYLLETTNTIESPEDIWFAPVTGTQLGNPGSKTITIKNQFINRCKDVTISQDGLIEEGENQYSAGC